MLRTILIPVEEGPHGTVADAHLWTVAERYESHVYGVRIVDVNTLEEGLHETEEARRLLERNALHDLEGFEQAYRSRHLTGRTEVIIGEPVEELVLCAPRADLMIIGEALSTDDEDRNERQAFIRAILHRITHPLLIAREGHEHLDRIVVGYDGSEKGGHALQWGADMAERSGASLTVVVATDRKEYGTRIIDDAEDYLTPYSLSMSPILFEGTPNEALTRTVHNEQADLIIIGSHGHGRLHELAFGSTTDHVLDNVDSSILIFR